MISDKSTDPGPPFLAATDAPSASQAGHGLGGPTSVGGQLRQDAQATNSVFAPKPLARTSQLNTDFKAYLRDHLGLTCGLDYSYLVMAATESPGEDLASGGVFRFYGQWDLVGRDSGDSGGLVYKVENRHRIGTDIAPQQLASELGYAGLLAITYSDVGWMLSNFYWKQQLWNNRIGFAMGIVDYTDYLDTYGLVSPWTDFGNLVFSTNPTIPGLNQGLGAAVRYQFTDQYYTLIGFADANGDPTNPLENFETFLDDADYLKHIELGWFSSWENRYVDNIHITVWQADSYADGRIPSGWGLVASACHLFAHHWIPFARFGYSDGGGGTFQEWSVSVGAGYLLRDKTDTLGLGLSWGRPSEKTFGAGVRDQYTAELYYRLQLLKHLAITPDIQVLVNPALNSHKDVVGIFGLRARLAF